MENLSFGWQGSWYSGSLIGWLKERGNQGNRVISTKQSCWREGFAGKALVRQIDQHSAWQRWSRDVRQRWPIAPWRWRYQRAAPDENGIVISSGSASGSQRSWTKRHCVWWQCQESASQRRFFLFSINCKKTWDAYWTKSDTYMYPGI